MAEEEEYDDYDSDYEEELAGRDYTLTSTKNFQPVTSLQHQYESKLNLQPLTKAPIDDDTHYALPNAVSGELKESRRKADQQR